MGRRSWHTFETGGTGQGKEELEGELVLPGKELVPRTWTVRPSHRLPGRIDYRGLVCDRPGFCSRRPEQIGISWESLRVIAISRRKQRTPNRPASRSNLPVSITVRMTLTLSPMSVCPAVDKDRDGSSL